MDNKNSLNNANLFQPAPLQNSAITLCPDGVYRWAYEFNLYKNPTILFMLYKIFGIIFLIMFGLMIVSDVSQPWFWDNPRTQILETTTNTFLFALFFFVLITASYYIYAAMQGGKYCVMFEMDDEKIIHRQYNQQIEKAQVIGAIATLAGAATGNLTTMGIGINSAVNNEMTSHFESVQSIKPYKRRGVIKVNEPLAKNQVYADGRDFDFVLKYISERCPQVTYI